MLAISKWLSIKYENILLEPTYFGYNINIDNSFQNTKSGIIQEPLLRSKEIDKDQINIIKELTEYRYEKIKQKIKNLKN